MSDTSQGPGWWLASDGKWYPPEQLTTPQPPRPPRGRPYALWAAIAATVVLAGGALVYANTGNSAPPKPVPPLTTPTAPVTSRTSSGPVTTPTSSQGSLWAQCMDEYDDEELCNILYPGSSTTTEPPYNPTTTEVPPENPTTTTPQAGGGSDVTWLIGQHAYDPQIDSLIQSYGCHMKQGAAGTQLCPSSGLIIEESITSDLIMGTTMVVSATSDESSPSSFSTYQGAMPFGLTWSTTRAEAESILISQFGQPVSFFDGGAGSYVSEDYAITGMNFAALTVQFGNDTNTLIRVAADINPPSSY